MKLLLLIMLESLFAFLYFEKLSSVRYLQQELDFSYGTCKDNLNLHLYCVQTTHELLAIELENKNSVSSILIVLVMTIMLLNK